MATIASLNVALSADSARLKRDLDRAGRTTQTWAGRQKARFASVAGSARGMGAAMAGIAAVMGTGKLLNNADALGKNAAAAGLSVEAYQRLQHGFEEAGVSQRGFEKGQKTLNKVFADAGDGLATSVDALAAVGLTYEDLAAMAPEERMLAVARGLDQVEDAGLRSAYAAELLGREMGTVRLDADQIIADGAGIAVVSEEAALQAAEMNDAMARVSATMESLLTNAIVPLIAGLAPLIEDISQFAQDNPMMASIVAGLGALGLAIAVAGAPIVGIVAAIAGAILVFQNWDEIVGFLAEKWDAFGERFPLVASLIKSALGTLAAPFLMIKDVVGSIFDLFTGEGDFLTRLSDFGKNIVDALVTNNPVVKLMENLAGVIKAPLNVVIGMFENMVNRVIDTINDITKFELDFGMFGSISNEGTNFDHLDIPAFAKGGYVTGPGTGTSDNIPALLSNGEFVVTAAATSQFGPALEAMNAGTYFSSDSSGGGSAGGSGGSGDSGVDDNWFSSVADDFAGTLKSELSKAFKSGDWSEIGATLMDQLTSSIIDKAVSSAVDWGMSLLPFADGGIVPSTPGSKSYADSVPAILQPGELVVPVDQVDSFLSGGRSGGGQTFNINVTGDVTRATRAQIVKMMPEIAAGTNMLNKESNYRR